MIQQIVQFITDPQNTFATHTLQTLALSFVPIVLASVIAISLGVVLAQRPVASFLASNISGFARAIPTLAFLFVVVPKLGTGFRPSALALTVLGIPPILLNTIAGLRGTDPAALEAGRGMGMTPIQLFARVQIPLALPIVAAGVRIAAVQIVATVPLAALIGAGTYGDYIFQGLIFLQQVPLLVGAGGIALLALLTDALLAVVQRALTPAGVRTGGRRDTGAQANGAPMAPESKPVAA